LHIAVSEGRRKPRVLQRRTVRRQQAPTAPSVRGGKLWRWRYFSNIALLDRVWLIIIIVNLIMNNQSIGLGLGPARVLWPGAAR
jgi:hypothetical protein